MSDPVLVSSGAHQDVISEELKRFTLSRNVDYSQNMLVNKSACVGEIPAVQDFLSAISVYGITIFTVASIALVVLLLIFIDTFKYIMKNASSRVKAHSAFVIGVYPVVGITTFCALIVPRSHLLAEAVTQGTFTACMYQLFCLLVAYCGGEAELIRRVKPARLSLRVGPCCCWPCCGLCLPMIDMTKDRVRYLRVLVLQLPVVQGLVYMIMLVMWAERESLYQVNYMYFQPIIILSILLGVWSMSMTIHILKDVLLDFAMPAKFLVLQLVLLLSKLQGLITRIIIWAGILPCKPPITPAVSANLIYNCLMLTEMVLLAYLARNIYKKVIPNIDCDIKVTNNSDGSSRNKTTIITVIPTTIPSLSYNHDNNNLNSAVNLNVDGLEVSHTHI